MQKPQGNFVPKLEPPSAVHTAVLTAIKVLHTIVWALFAGCILAIPIASWYGANRVALWLAAIVSVEVAVLALNKWRCPLTALAARYPTERRANFDIYLPEWLAKHNKVIFGTIYLVGVATAGVRWVLAAR
jgi:hypothetical protein